MALTVLSVVFGLLLLVVLAAGLNYGAMAIWGEHRGDLIGKLCPKGEKPTGTSKTNSCRRVVHGVVGGCAAATLVLAVLALLSGGWRV